MTKNHNYQTPPEGTVDWHIPLNRNFKRLDTDVEIRDTDSNRSDYTPRSGAKFLSIDTGNVYLGDDTVWRKIGSLNQDEMSSTKGGKTWMSVAAYGAVGNGMSDDTQAIKDAVSTGRPIFFPSGTYRISEPIQIAHGARSRHLVGTATSIKGDGTIIKFDGDSNSGSSTGVFDMLDGSVEAPVIKNIHIDAGGTADFGVRMGASGGNITEAVLEGLTVTDAAVDCIHLVRPIVTSIRDCSVYGAGRDGYHVIGDGTSVGFETDYAQSCGRHGYYLSQLNYSSFINCASDDNAGKGYYVDNKSSRKAISFYSCGAENNGEQSYYIGGTYGVVISGCADDAVANSHPIVEFAACDGVVVIGYWTYNDPANAPAFKWSIEHIGAGSITTYPSYSDLIGCHFPSGDVYHQVSQISSKIGSRQGTIFHNYQT